MPLFPHRVNEILIAIESGYSHFLVKTELPDHTAIKLAYYYAKLVAVQNNPMDDPHHQIMLENCLKHETSRLAKELNEM